MLSLVQGSEVSTNLHTFITSSLFNVLAVLVLHPSFLLLRHLHHPLLKLLIAPFAMLHLVSGINSLYLFISLILVPTFFTNPIPVVPLLSPIARLSWPFCQLLSAHKCIVSSTFLVHRCSFSRRRLCVYSTDFTTWQFWQRHVFGLSIHQVHPFIHSPGQIWLPRYLMNGLSVID